MSKKSKKKKRERKLLQRFQELKANQHRSHDDEETQDTFGSRKRKLTPVDFVFPKENGFAKAFQFTKPSQQSPEKQAFEALAKPRQNISESLEEIFNSKKKQKVEKVEHEDANRVDDTPDLPTRRKRAYSVDETGQPVGGHLSGKSVDEVVKDKGGLRPRANSTDFELKLPRRGLCDEREVLMVYNWNLDRFNIGASKPKGLFNLGNTCFLNSTVQCLAHIPSFCQSIIEMPATPRAKKNGMNLKVPQGKRITLILKNLFEQMHQAGSNASPVTPKSIVKAVPSLGSIGNRNGYKFRHGQQEDAHEFLVHLLDAMHDGELREAGINQDASGWRDRLPVARLDETTLIHRIFGGYFRSQVRCTSCGYRSNTYDPFLDLSLEVSKKSCQTIYDAINQFTRKETLDSENRWKCSGCKKHVCATKQLTVFRPPLSLCIQLKRFTYDQSSFSFSSYGFGGGGRGKKISKPIEFPRTLKLPLSDGRSCQYELVGIVIHLGGSATSGHYTACIRKPSRKGTYQWFHMDDSFVEPISEKSVLQHKDAYLLFYTRSEVQVEFPTPPNRHSSMSDHEVDSIGVSDDSGNEGTQESITQEKASEKANQFGPIRVGPLVNERAPDDSDNVNSDEGESSESGEDSDKVEESTNGKSSSPSAVTSSEREGKPPTGSGTQSTNNQLSGAIANGETKSNSAESSSSLSSSEEESSSDDSSSSSESPETTGKDDANVADSKKGTHDTSKTKISVDRGHGRGRVEIMLGPRKKSRAWIPSTFTKKASEGFELLGTKQVSKWDENEDDGKPGEAREDIAKEIDRREKLAKGNVHLDRWDAMLDSGKQKKVKKKNDNSRVPPGSNRFQRIHDGIASMKRKHGRKPFFAKKNAPAAPQKKHKFKSRR